MHKADGLLDTNVFVHALKNDNRTDECVRFLEQVQTGTTTGARHPLIVHELTYVLSRFGPPWDRGRIVRHIVGILGWPGVVGDTSLLRDAVLRWGSAPRVSFVDAYLIEVALAEDRPVYTINVRDFAPFGVTAPSPLPSNT